ncbi:MAG: ribonuclease H-like domain-containing protein [bacterium]
MRPAAASSEPQLLDLPMVKAGRAERLKAAGIDTVEKLWKADIGKLAEHPAFATDDGLLGQLPLLQGYAEAHAKGTAVVYAADERIFNLKKPIVHLDLEFDGPAAEIFLYGFLDHDTNRQEQWFDASRTGQEGLLRNFQKICKDDDPTVVTWGGTSSDVVQLRRACEKYKMDTAWLRKVKWLDLQTQVVYTGNPETQRIYLPVKNFSSDTVAKFFGYQKPRLKVKDGYQALKLYQAYKRAPREGIKRDLMEYNLEDIKHTKLILEGVRNLMQTHR